VIDFTYLDVLDGELVVKELAAVDFHSNRIPSYVLKRPYTWEEFPMFNARINEAIDQGCNWYDGDILYSELYNVLHFEASSGLAVCFFGPQDPALISNHIDLRLLLSSSSDALNLLM
jgi:hypothetical protein